MSFIFFLFIVTFFVTDPNFDDPPQFGERINMGEIENDKIGSVELIADGTEIPASLFQ